MASNVGATLMLPDEVVSLASGADVVASWTAVSIGSQTGSQKAKAALLRVEVFAAGATVQLREKGTNPAAPREFNQSLNVTNKAMKTSALFVVPVDETEYFEYKIPTMEIGVDGTGWEIFLEGWYV